MKTPMQFVRAIMRKMSRNIFSFATIVATLASAAGASAAQPDQKPQGAKAGATPAPSGEIVELPKLTVTANRELPPPEAGWSYSRFLNFEVLSELGERETKNFINYFGQYVNILAAIVPPTEIKTNIPAKIILCDRVSTYSKFGDAFHSRARAFYDKEQIVFVANVAVVELLPDTPRGQGDTGDAGDALFDELFITPDTGVQSAGEFGTNTPFGTTEYYGAGGAAPITDFYTTGNNPIAGMDSANPQVSDPALAGQTASAGPLAFAGNDPFTNSINALQREYVRLYLARMNPKPPSWFVSAVSTMFMGINVGDKTVSLNAIENSLLSLAKRGAVPLRQVFEDEPMDEAYLSGHASATAFAFMHYCLYRSYSKLQPAFAKFLLASSDGPAGEAVFEQCFGMKYKKMELELQNYAERADYKQQFIKFKEIPAPKNVTVRPATEPEVGRMKGEAFLVLQKPADAQTELITPYLRKDTDPDLLGALGLVLLGTENTDRAHRLLEMSFKAGVRRTRVCLAVAGKRLADALEAARKKDGENAKLDIDQLKSVLEPISGALEQKPPAPGAYMLMADMWKHSSIPPKEAHLKLLANGCRLFPGDIDLACATAALQIDNGYLTDAAALLQRAYPAAQTSEDKERIQELAAKIRQAAASANSK